ncbi:MAG: hypothetical protein VKK80_07490 [Prochlorothrix sp.]|nr:hypothetical protein [Prochlorothrix sp.]
MVAPVFGGQRVGTGARPRPVYSVSGSTDLGALLRDGLKSALRSLHYDRCTAGVVTGRTKVRTTIAG